MPIDLPADSGLLKWIISLFLWGDKMFVVAISSLEKVVKAVD